MIPPDKNTCKCRTWKRWLALWKDQMSWILLHARQTRAVRQLKCRWGYERFVSRRKLISSPERNHCKLCLRLRLKIYRNHCGLSKILQEKSFCSTNLKYFSSAPQETQFWKLSTLNVFFNCTVGGWLLAIYDHRQRQIQNSFVEGKSEKRATAGIQEE